MHKKRNILQDLKPQYFRDVDFTITKYDELLQALAEAGYAFKTFFRFIEDEEEWKVVILRHDVDQLPGNALRFAQLEHALGIMATYYFRMVPRSFDPGIINEISAMGHEIGYHYEDLSRTAGNKERAIDSFRKNLTRMREVAPVKTACMHGRPLSKWDNRKLWEDYDYRDFGIVAEPCLDVDYSRVMCLTDTGRSWRRSEATVRDRVDSGFSLEIHSTSHLVNQIQNGLLPSKIIFNTHPHRWSDPNLRWVRDLLLMKFYDLSTNFKEIVNVQ